MSKEDRSSFLLQDFEASAVRLKRKLRLVLNKNLRRDIISEKNVSLTEFIFYLGNYSSDCYGYQHFKFMYFQFCS